jgi:CDGSH-type Zn-finger protein
MIMGNKKEIKKGPWIRVEKDGPYMISGKVPLGREKIVADNEGNSLSWEKTAEIPLKENYSLCRCGKSKDKPYCDGAHIESKFNGTETAFNGEYESSADNIVGPDLILRDLPSLCSSARFCDRAGGIWDLTLQSNEPTAKKTAIQEGRNCPSGRLVVKDWRAKSTIEPDFEPSISLVEDPEAGVSGPIWVKGGIPVESAEGYVYEKRNRVTLCRCGKSFNKPFCNGTHISVGFQDESK